MPDEYSDVFDRITAVASVQDPETGSEEKIGQQVGAGPDQDPPAGDEVSSQEVPGGSEPPFAPDEGGGSAVESQPGQEGQTEDKDKDTGQDTSGPSAEEMEELRRKAHGYDSMFGRLNKEREERKRLEARLARLEGGQTGERQTPPSGQTGPQQQAAGSAEESGRIEIPEEIRDDVTEFGRRYPDYSRLMEEDSERGQALRDLLQEYGPDIASVKAENMANQERIDGLEAERQQSAVQAYWDRIGQEHPEVAEAFAQLEDDPSQAQAFVQALNDWIETKPFREAQYLMEVRDGADAEAAAQMVSTFKSETGWSLEGPQESSPSPDSGSGSKQQTGRESRSESGPGNQAGRKRKQKETSASDPAAAAAVPSRSTPPPQPRAGADDFDAAWEEATGEKK